uniref:Uncharacterized protein n=1 Tax=Meloidogyne hapla TaxID=6305 RepID=A0A1I8BER3_MELHA
MQNPPSGHSSVDKDYVIPPEEETSSDEDISPYEEGDHSDNKGGQKRKGDANLKNSRIKKKL